ncbi:hypothetical protein W97_09040 [Coniosporium apollinis CBS 100218]|uniref:CPA1 family monovalent cation:H+ antiporter n=1 Tax=Coniosporium apollinis (strain CBS 100218) TaxID=1168221 RepID=R7Z6H8_CONA1|nr:uncharacterized protein W97_09040 [Coniosporium apollinis CBS 100218]EON69777.1 hypothetical protein W97_09040 [Coniosporium apollinis CBS 100218]
MAWDHLSITKAHLVYLILGGFTSLFMLCSSIIKERLYIGEATVATICGIIFGPHAANLINPRTWGNTDLITFEFSRIVLVVQCFAVGVELPKSYMERHWKSVTLLLVPVMTFGWLITSLFIWWMLKSHLNWLDSLCIAACVTATDPVLASSVVGKGKFAKRVPKHLRDLLSAESGCNDGMAFPFIYLAVYIIRYAPDTNKVAFHWFCYTILYECIFGAIFGVTIGYLARRAIRIAHEKDLIDRESFLVFYFVLALFCAGSGSLLGMDDLLVGFACGVGFSNDGWFLEKTEESHVSNVIDLLINLAFFVYFGTIIPWDQFNADVIGTSPWRLVVISIFVLFFRRIPIMLALKPIIPDLKTWREALFAGHFGPIGVGAIFIAILARAELETEHTTPLAVLPPPGFPHLNIIEIIWPVTAFLVVVSILVHGSSIAVFTLGKRINTLTLTYSYTQAKEEGPSWMDRLPRIQSRSKSSMSLRRPDDTDSSYDEKTGALPPVGVPGQFLRRQKEEEGGATSSRSSSAAPRARRSKKWENGLGPGGPISQSAITPQSRNLTNRDHVDAPEQARDSDTIAMNSDESPDSSVGKEGKRRKMSEPEAEVFQEGDDMVIEDEEGNVLSVTDTHGATGEERRKMAKEEGRNQMVEKDVQGGVAQTENDYSQDDGKKLMREVSDAVEHPQRHWRDMRKKMMERRKSGAEGVVAGSKPGDPPKEAKRTHGPAFAYQFGNTVIVEDEDGEVIKKYEIDAPKRPGTSGDRKTSFVDERTRQRLQRMGTYLGMPQHHKDDDLDEEAEAGASSTQQDDKRREEKRKRQQQDEEDDDQQIRFTVTTGGQRMSKADFLREIRNMDPKSRAQAVEESDAPEMVKREARRDLHERGRANTAEQNRPSPQSRRPTQQQDVIAERDEDDEDEVPQQHRGSEPMIKFASHEDKPAGPEGLTLVTSNDEDIPFHSVADDLANFRLSAKEETAAQRRRRMASTAGQGQAPDERGSSDGNGNGRHSSTADRPNTARQPTNMDAGETAAERRRREGALGIYDDDDRGGSSSETSDDERPETGRRDPHASMEQQRERERERERQRQEESRATNIRFAEPARPEPVAAREEGETRRRGGAGGIRSKLGWKK